MIWDKLIDCQEEILNIFNEHAIEIEEPGLAYFNQPKNGWINRVWANKDVRRAHIDVVDVRDSKGLWMMHVCCFPVLNNDAPIYGFDVIAGKNKMTGAFHDFSPSPDPQHPLVQWYEDEADAIITLALANLKVWFESVPEYTGYASTEITAGAQNYYCHNQQQNPHTPRVMKSLGLNEADVDKFCTDMLFPKLA